ncbi:MAG: glycosyltransferase family 4 protein [Prevotellaceae bacterium]|jgi:glycosyltransferase involved in cell wall biosynthesis|nr:glycosyltransferase family 4 protein [Prevotellaceae bacterium]
MKIAYLLGSLNRGGTETLLLDVFGNAHRAGYAFMGIYRKDGILQSHFYATQQKMVRLAPAFPCDLVYFYRLRKLLREEKVNIVHAQQPLDALYAWIACLGTKIKVVQTFHGYDSLLSGRRHVLTAFSAKRTDKNIFVSNFQKDYFINKYQLNSAKQTTVYNGISFEKIDEAVVSEELLQRRNTGLLLGSVGSFVGVRDQMTVCRFLNLLNRQNIDFQFVFAGLRIESEHYLFDACVKYCEEHALSDKVHFLGGRSDVPAILKQLDAFIYASDHDTFGIAVIEAVAAGTPVFVNDWGVMKEITNNGELATIYKTKDEQDLLAKFLIFLQNREKYVSETQVRATAVRQRFSIERHLSELEKMYNTLFN